MNEAASSEAAFQTERSRMVERDLRRRGIRDARVLDAMRRVPRHRFVSPDLVHAAYADSPLPTMDGQTISQPYIVALMAQALALRGGEKVLELGTGSGYQAAVLAELGAEVWTVERSPTLFAAAASLLAALAYERVHPLHGDGTVGLPTQAPFDAILATGSLPRVPRGLLIQLRRSGVLVAPIGTRDDQRLLRIEYDPPHEREETLCVCRFVPLVGAAGWPPTAERDVEDGR
ncbi:MAG: protein-L-isoaspartate(D-aspartate) O-methyltransferase [Candidatus Bipolaricaulis sp.]|nr:protein-L-isoaspartate(D-aspartate) O-methyltransferase [Candidatus Bipolaricaulis sp.]